MILHFRLISEINFQKMQKKKTFRVHFRQKLNSQMNRESGKVAFTGPSCFKRVHKLLFVKVTYVPFPEVLLIFIIVFFRCDTPIVDI